MKRSHGISLRGPIQTNSTDCGLFMLQAIETFLSEDEPDAWIKDIEKTNDHSAWFPPSKAMLGDRRWGRRVLRTAEQFGIKHEMPTFHQRNDWWRGGWHWSFCLDLLHLCYEVIDFNNFLSTRLYHIWKLTLILHNVTATCFAAFIYFLQIDSLFFNQLVILLSLLIFFCNCKMPYNNASAVGGHPGT